MPSLLPYPSYERDVNRLIKYYKKAFIDIASNLKILRYGIERTQAESLLNQIAFILIELDTSTKSWCEESIKNAFSIGQASAIVSIGEAASLAEATNGVAFSMLARETVEVLINDTYGDLLLATKNTERKIKQLVKKSVSDTLRVKAIEQLGRRTLSGEIAQKLTQKGLTEKLNAEAWVGIVDKMGRRWNLSTYCDMVVRTKLTHAHIEGVRCETLERGVDLAVISSHGAKDLCRMFEGMVISLHGLTKGYMTYDEVRTTGKIFHPSCKHHVSPIRDISLLPKELQEKHKKAQVLVRKNIK